MCGLFLTGIHFIFAINLFYCSILAPQVFEVKNDARMNRTRLRPLPSGRITRPHAVMWASSMGIAGTALLACEVIMVS